ncbi:hypothetical protein GCM10010112_12770 [Actinoplanes lobatus]|uniref:Phage tail-like protein n=1 Tax=Actinoplanes lobatus TaxID=113568 RepID=A0A7W7HMC6_9ACTN|nr:phage tail protein [Actinoplanes lobatus]MBB4753115.1 phage tail-like protein [Actinoplanes lobatus]GGN58746.1 hypothetical protein GCM10010112_12770 [Actinoplanes lobatus]GIE43025.1 hypothetical protein Alo02nite_59230 [Actinoplanes lobatus]
MSTHLYTNRDDRWPDFTLNGLEIGGGRLRLARLPVLDGPQPAGPVNPDRPAGLAIAADGTVFFTEDGQVAGLPCAAGTGALLVHPERNALFAADTGNRRLRLFQLGTGQLVDVWEDVVAYGLATDRHGRVYSADPGDHHVRQFTAGGREITSFAARLREPVAVATDDPLIHVLDRGAGTIVTLDQAGRTLAQIRLPLTGRALGLAVTADSFFVGDNTAAGGRILRLSRDGELIGAAVGYAGPVTALAVDPAGDLWVHPGAGVPARLPPTGHVREGVAWGGPFGGFTKPAKTWQRVTASAAALPVDAHLRFFVHVTNDPTARPPVSGTGPDAFADPAWYAGPSDVTQHLVDRPPARYAWLGLRMTGSGHVSADVEQVRLDFDRPGLLPLLPAVYGDGVAPTDVLPRYLALVESLFEDVEREIGDLSRLDPAGATAPFLAELARWTATPARPGRTEAQTREDVASAYARTATTGTAAGLRATLEQATGLTVRIEEPLAQAAWWALPAAGSTGASVLGVTTMLAAADPQGAVLGSTATVDRSHLISGEDYGAPLFDAYAHRFTVRLYGGADYSEERRQALVDVLEHERPADTEYHICRVEPGLSIGMQARIGIDTVLGGDPPATRLTDGEDLRLGGRRPGRLGRHSRIGRNTVLGSSAIED